MAMERFPFLAEFPTKQKKHKGFHIQSRMKTIDFPHKPLQAVGFLSCGPPMSTCGISTVSWCTRTRHHSTAKGGGCSSWVKGITTSFTWLRTRVLIDYDSLPQYVYININMYIYPYIYIYIYPYIYLYIHTHWNVSST